MVLTEKDVREIIRGTGILKGCMDLTIGKKSLVMEGFQHLKQFDKTIVVPEIPEQKRIEPQEVRLSPKGTQAINTMHGRHFKPTLHFTQGAPLSNEDLRKIWARTKRGKDEVYGILQKAKRQGITLSIKGNMRGVDGPGSSLDLPVFQTELTKETMTELKELPSTPTLTSNFSATITFEACEEKDKENIVYIAEDYGLTREHPYRCETEVQLKNGKTPNGQIDGIGYIFKNIFGLAGIKITLQNISPIAIAGGMESSNAFNVSLITAASVLSGVNLSFAEIFNLAVKLENDEFGGITGGQGHLATILGGAQHHIWLSGIKGNSYSAVSVPLLENEELQELTNHIMIAQVGVEYQNGKQVIHRTANLVNSMWTDILKDKDEEGVALQTEQLELTTAYITALKNKDYQAMINIINRYVDIRNLVVKRWLTIMITEYRKGTEGNKHEYTKKVFDPENRDYNDMQIIRDLFEKDTTGDILIETPLYCYEPINTLITNAREENIAIMPMGAGGPGAIVMAVSEKGKEHIRQFFENKGIPYIAQNDNSAILKMPEYQLQQEE